MDIFSAHDEKRVREALPPGGFGDILYRDFVHALYRTHMTDFSDPLNLKRFPPALREEFAIRCVVNSLSLAKDVRGEDQSTTRLLLLAADGAPVETVIMRFPSGRNTICVSSQSGCAMGCAFCATGNGGFRRDLAYPEILDQIDHANRILAREGKKTRNVVFMGMGEPLANYENVAKAIHALASPSKYNLARKRVTVSTCGLPREMERFASEFPDTSLILSLHAPDDATRRSLMPASAAWTCRELIAVADSIASRKRHRGMIAYLMIKDVTDMPWQADSLASQLKSTRLQVNLVVYNPVYPSSGTGTAFTASTPERVDAFKAMLRKAGIPVTVRASMGADTESACGQLTGSRK